MHRPELMIASCLNNLSKGDTIRRDSWPPHATIIRWFSVDPTDLSAINSILQKATQRSIRIIGEHTEHFGPRHVNVRLIGSQALSSLHNYLIDSLKTECNFEPLVHNIEDFRPHITIKGEYDLSEGDVIDLRTLELIERDDNRAPYVRIREQFRFES